MKDIFENELRFVITPEKRIRQLLYNLSIKSREIFNISQLMYLSSNNEVVFLYNEKNKVLQVNVNIWAIFENEFTLDMEQTRALLTNTIQEELKLDIIRVIPATWVFLK